MRFCLHVFADYGGMRCGAVIDIVACPVVQLSTRLLVTLYEVEMPFIVTLRIYTPCCSLPMSIDESSPCLLFSVCLFLLRRYCRFPNMPHYHIPRKIQKCGY